VLAVDGKRLAVLRSDGRIEILRGNGRLVGTIAVPGPARTAALGDGQLVVLTSTRLLVYELRTRKLEHGWPLAGSAGSRKLVGVSDGFAAYTETRTIKLVRLGDGRRRTIAAGGTGSILAALTQGGLFYAYVLPASEYRGRLAFVRLEGLSHRVTRWRAAVRQ
jgi:hypothetical protein